MNNNIIEVKNLSKSFGENKAVDDISFCVPAGSFFAFLGQNGAGKSTTIGMLTGLLEKGSGQVHYDGGVPFADFKNKIGIVFQSNVFDDKLTVGENLRLYATFFQKCNEEKQSRYNKVLSLFGLNGTERQRFGTLSGGQKRKAEIARALLSSPKILFLDEPTTGLDPKTRMEVWDILQKVRQENGITLFLTTHYMEETEGADKVVIIHKGRIVCEGSPSQLKARHSFDKLYIVPKDEISFEKVAKKQGIKHKKTADKYIIPVGSAAESIDLLKLLRDEIELYEVKSGSMDDVFLSVVGESIAGESTAGESIAGESIAGESIVGGLSESGTDRTSADKAVRGGQ